MSQLSNSFYNYYVKHLSLCTISLPFEMGVAARFEGKMWLCKPCKMCPKIITLPVNLKKTMGQDFLKSLSTE